MTREAVGRRLVVAAFAVCAVGSCGPRDRSAARVSHPLGTEPLVWSEEQLIMANDTVEFGQFGYAISLADERALVGAYGDEEYRGAVYVLVRSGSVWSEEQKLIASDGAVGDDFGWSVALDGDRALVGAYAGDAVRRAAYVFVRSGSSWTEEQKLVASDPAEEDDFGWSVSLDGDRALVGAYGNDDGRGAAYVFVRSGSTWTEEQKLVASDMAEQSFGWSAALAGDRALVGAPGNDTARGAAHVFVRSGSSWTEEQKLVSSDLEDGDRFGVAVALTEARALVGAYWDDTLRGSAYVFARSAGSWTEEQKLVSSGGMSGDRFGGSLSLGDRRAVIGAYASEYARGTAYVFARSGSVWTEEQALVGSDLVEGENFGWSVSLADDHLMVGAHYAYNLRGSVYVFARALDDGEPCPTDTECASGFCVDGVCCDSICGGTCEACTAGLKGEGEDGACGFVAPGQNPPKSSADPTVDCPPDAACGSTGKCVSEDVGAPTAIASGDDSGCGCRAGGSRGLGVRSSLGLGMVLLLLGRRRSAALQPAVAPQQVLTSVA